MRKLSICHLSDSHLHPLEEILDGYEADILIHSGDGLNSGTQKEGFKFLEDWKKATKRFQYKIYSPGNHDITYGNQNFFWKGNFKAADTFFLDGEGVEIEGYYFWGHCKIPPIGGYWYGEASELERRRALSMIPIREKTVLISHGPPMDNIDVCHFEQLDGTIKRGPHWGCPELRDYLYEREIPVVACLSGHLHSAREVNGSPTKTILGGKTLISNASICDEEYNPSFSPVVIEL